MFHQYSKEKGKKRSNRNLISSCRRRPFTGRDLVHQNVHIGPNNLPQHVHAAIEPLQQLLHPTHQIPVGALPRIAQRQDDLVPGHPAAGHLGALDPQHQRAPAARVVRAVLGERRRRRHGRTDDLPVAAEAGRAGHALAVGRQVDDDVALADARRGRREQVSSSSFFFFFCRAVVVFCRGWRGGRVVAEGAHEDRGVQLRIVVGEDVVHGRVVVLGRRGVLDEGEEGGEVGGREERLRGVERRVGEGFGVAGGVVIVVVG